MLVATWIVAGLLAVVHLMAGASILAKTDGKLPRNVERTIGALEILGAIGLTAPKLTGIAEWLTPTAAFCFFALQIGAAMFHIRHGQYKVLPVNFVLAAGGAFVGLSWLLWI